MNTGTVFLIAVAIGVIYLMVRTAQGSRAAAGGADEAGPGGVADDAGGRPAADGQAEMGQGGTTSEQPHSEREHGCC